jgi:hypothetical protein
MASLAGSGAFSSKALRISKFLKCLKSLPFCFSTAWTMFFGFLLVL